MAAVASAGLTCLDPPQPGDAIEIAPGIMWTRLALPYAPGHVNAYLLEDGHGWVAVDAGLDNAATRAAWERIFVEIMRGRPLTGVLITHWHSDHMGLAGWLCERFGAPLLMSESEYMHGLLRQFTPRATRNDTERRFFLSHGLDRATTDAWVANGHRYLDMLYRMPSIFRRLADGDVLAIGSRRFEVLTGPGHSPEAVMLYCPDDRILLCGDQVIPGIATTIGVQAFEPEGDPVSLYLRSLDRLGRMIGPDVLVLPGHDRVYRGLPIRLEELRAHLAERCGRIVEACREAPLSVHDLLSTLFRRAPGPTWVGFLAGEVAAQVNYLVGRGLLTPVRDDGRPTAPCSHGLQPAAIRRFEARPPRPAANDPGPIEGPDRRI